MMMQAAAFSSFDLGVEFAAARLLSLPPPRLRSAITRKMGLISFYLLTH